jgi:hypothetical protein
VSLVDTKQRVLPETDTPEWAAWRAAARLVEVEYVGKMEAVVFRFGDGRILGLPLQELEGLDSSPITRVSLLEEGDVALIEQFSGNRLEVPWDLVLYRADRRHRRLEADGEPEEEAQIRDVDRVIGERVREESRRRKWTCLIEQVPRRAS